MVRVQSLLDVSLRGKPIGAVHDYMQDMIFGFGDSRTRLALRPDAPYFNAGVVCFDWRVTIASGLLQRAKAFAIESAHLCTSHDQDALNKAFEEAWTPLDPRWNFMIVAVPEEVLRLEYPARLRPYISHFAGPVKPWMANFPKRYEPFRAWYRAMLRDSPWPDFTAPTSVVAAETSATSRVNSPKRRLLAQLGWSQGAFKGLSFGQIIAAKRQLNATALKLSSGEAPEDGEGNPELERVLDLMIAEAAAADIRDAY